MPTTTNHFANTVRKTLVENKLAGRKPDSIRGLAKAMADGNTKQAEVFKRSLFKWMSPDGPRPSQASRVLVARKLSLEDAALEEVPRMALTGRQRDMLAALAQALEPFKQAEGQSVQS